MTFYSTTSENYCKTSCFTMLRKQRLSMLSCLSIFLMIGLTYPIPAHASEDFKAGIIHPTASVEEALLLPGEALAFNAAGDHILVNTNPDFSSDSEMTIEAWVYGQDLSGTVRTIFSKWSPIQYQLTIASGIVQFALLTSSGGQTASAATAIPANEWVHLAATYDGSVMRVIINGEVAGETAQSGTIAVNNGPLYIGRDSNLPSGSFKGKMDEIRMWSRALNACEIANNMFYEFPSNFTGLELRYGLDQGVASDDNTGVTSVNDSYFPGYTTTGTLVNFALTGSVSNWVEPGAPINYAAAPALVYPTWYQDGDLDGYYAMQITQCYSPGAGWTSTLPINGAGDCDDNDPLIWQSILGWYDFDGDGYNSTGGVICIGSSFPAHYYPTTLGLDCDDNNASAYQFETWYLDADNDGHYASILPSCGSPGPGYNTVGGLFYDCNDSDPLVWEDLNAYVDLDGDGYTVGSLLLLCTNGTLPAGYVSTSLGEDCNDANPLLNALATPSISISSNVGNGICPGTEVTFSANYSNYIGTVAVVWILNENLMEISETYTNAALVDGDVVYGILYSEEVCMPEVTFSNTITMQVTSSLTWYNDADNDGYASGSAVQCTSPGAGWTTTTPASPANDCNNNNNTIYPGATEVCGNSTDDDCDGFINEGCPGFVQADTPTGAVLTAYSSNMNYPNCYPISGSVIGASDSPESAVFTGADTWYRFVAQSTAVSITMTSSGMDDAIALYSKTENVYNLLDSENSMAGANDFERLNYSGLTPGTTYYISAGAASGAGSTFSLCIQHLMPSGCANTIPAGGFPLCNTYKAIFRGSPATGVTYGFNFTGVGGGASGTTSLSGTNGLIVLSHPTLALRYGGIYNVSVDVRYALLNSGGTTDEIIVNGNISSANCSGVQIAAQPHVEVRLSQRCPATLLRSSVLTFSRVNDNPLPCGAISYTYEFTAIPSCADFTPSSVPAEFTTAASSPFLPLGVLTNLGNMGHWSVRIRPNFSYGNGQYGPPQAIAVAGTAASAILPDDMITEPFEKSTDETSAIALYPNPNKGQLFFLNITDTKEELLNVSIFDNMGRLCYSMNIQSAGSVLIPIHPETDLLPGLYHIEVSGESETKRIRMMVE